MRIKKEPHGIWGEYRRAVSYNQGLELYDTVKKNENFFIGKQWEGLNAPDLNKPVINVLRRVVSYFISMIVADDIGVSFTPFIATGELTKKASVWSKEVERVIELADIKAKSRDVIRNAAVDGDGCLYFYFDHEADTGQLARGRLECEVVDNTNVMFGNPYSSDLQKQPYVLIELRKTVDSVREEARRFGMSEEDALRIVPDSDANMYNPGSANESDLVTVLVKFWREGGTIHAIKTTKELVIRGEWDTGYKRYPLAMMSWDKVKNSYHGVAAITGLIPNQISINQLFAMAIHSIKSNAFPKMLYDATKISGWSNKVGQAIGVIGNPNDAIASNFRGADMSSQVMQVISQLISYTLEFMGASDAALGNINPQNTSAIIATQKASAMPLELQKLAYYRFTEDYVRTIVDMMSVDYGIREVESEQDGNPAVELFNFSEEGSAGLKMKVDIGSAAYWSELTQTQTMDNLFSKGIITDVITYLESIPEQYLRNKNKIISKIKEQRQEAEQMQMQEAPAVGAEPPLPMPELPAAVR